MVSLKTLQVKEDDDGIRLDRWFKRHFPDIAHGQLEKLLRKGQIRVDGKRAKSNTRIEEGQEIRVPPVKADARPRPKKVTTDNVTDRDVEMLRQSVIHMDDHVIAINKPAGLAVQGGSGQSKHIDAMLNGLQFEMKERPKLIHRLDKDTSGVLLLARSSKAASMLTKAFKTKDVHKIYWAAVVGMPKIKFGKIDMALEKQAGKFGDKVVADQDGKRAVTYYRTVDNAAGKASWLAMMPETGRTHQLRVHCSELGTPILGDGKYGGQEAFLEGAEGVAKQLHLHAKAIKFPHPTGGYFQVVSDLSPHMKATWKYLGFDEKMVVDPFEDFYEQWYEDHE
ncbi:MAG: RluA family pseudouridine synthase [Rhodospirillaceae bacterium]|jgi:23S rRNA pseudouridine955/2504/2580 synthase|nr:RluA family pseudouridine synthase [Rhodospirillaceae bacterium]MBT7265467.1 RluA family pseudouridine synthase [Rhodospirillaceae bacterium]